MNLSRSLSVKSRYGESRYSILSEKNYLLLYESKDKRIIWDDNQYLYIAATYLNNHDLNKAKEVIENRFGKKGLRKKYNEVIKYFENSEE